VDTENRVSDSRRPTFHLYPIKGKVGNPKVQPYALPYKVEINVIVKCIEL